MAVNKHHRPQLHRRVLQRLPAGFKIGLLVAQRFRAENDWSGTYYCVWKYLTTTPSEHFNTHLIQNHQGERLCQLMVESMTYGRDHHTSCQELAGSDGQALCNWITYIYFKCIR